MLQRSVLLVLVLCQLALLGGRARADDVVECDLRRDNCDAKILELCPAGAEVLEEQELQGSAGPRYRMTFRCRGGDVGATAAPAPAEAPAPATPGVVGGTVAAPGESAQQAELRSVDMRLAELKAERSRHSLVGPIILTAAGFSAALVFAAVAASDTSDDPDDDFSPVTGTSLDDDEDHRGAVIAGSVLAVLSAGVGVGGLVWLLRRKKARKAHDGEIEQLKLRQEQLRLQGVSYSFAVDPVGGRLLLRARF